jgi:hypothetical protein
VGVVYDKQLQELYVLALRASAFGCKVTKSRNVIKIIVNVESNIMADVQKPRTIPKSSKSL